jgi:ribonuclease HI
MENEIIMYTDGGSRNNPGPAAVGVWIETLNKKYSEYIGEYEALIFGLKKIKALLGGEKAKKSGIKCFLDSELAVNQLNHKYKLKEKNVQGLFLKVWNLMLDFGSVAFYHIPSEENKIADKLVNKALDEKEKQGNLL